MFLTQTEGSTFKQNFNFRTTNQEYQKTKVPLKRKFKKHWSTNSQIQNYIKKKLQNKNSFLLENARQPKVPNPEKKWKKIVDLYNMPNPDYDQNYVTKPIRPGYSFYRLLTNEQVLKKFNLQLNFPQTFCDISGQIMYIRTHSETKLVQSSKIQRQKYQQLMEQTLIRQNSILQQHKLKYKQHYDILLNSHAPVIITKIFEDEDTIFQVDVQSYKNFQERRSRPSTNKIVQRFIYPRNMRAIIMRICYCQAQRGQQRGQFHAYRFQNVDNIFRVNKKNSQIYQTFKLQSTISATYDRQNKIQYSKIINMKGLQKYIQPSTNLINFLQRSQKIKINTIFLDFVVDLYDKPWLINIKKIDYEENKYMNSFHSLNITTRNSLHFAGSYGICRLCSIEYQKKYLKKSISNKMLFQFLLHLRKRMKVDEFEKFGFIKDIIKKNTKNYITLQVCQGCYRIVAEQYKLIQSQQKLAKICSINSIIETRQIKNHPLILQKRLKQWRLMLYFVSLQNIPSELMRQQDQIILKYSLGNNSGIQYSWRIDTACNINSNNFKRNFKIDVDLKKIKLHYFYSDSLQIDTFLKQTQIQLHIAGVKMPKIFAKGSSGSLSTFCRQFHPQLCLRQTSSILLFYEDGKYCQLTIKIGLICDGAYQFAENVSLIPLNKVLFTDNNFTNSNPIPREWMEAFGVNQQMCSEQKNYSDIVGPQINEQFLRFQSSYKKTKQNKIRSNTVGRKSLHFYR